MKTIDFGKTLKDLYTAGGTIKEVTVGTGTYLWAEGRGEPGGEAFRRCIEALNAVVYTAKSLLKKAGTVDSGVSKLETLWPQANCGSVSRSEGSWRVIVRVPEQVSAAVVKQAHRSVAEKKGLDVSLVKRMTWREGKCLQVMHIGPYNEIGRSYGRLKSYAVEHGLVLAGAGHEIYVSDPRRVEPARLKTIVRLPVKRAKKK